MCVCRIPPCPEGSQRGRVTLTDLSQNGEKRHAQSNMPAVDREGVGGEEALPALEGVAGRGNDKLKRRVGSVTPDSSPNTLRKTTRASRIEEKTSSQREKTREEMRDTAKKGNGEKRAMGKS